MRTAREAALARAAATATPSDRPSQRRQVEDGDAPRNRAPAKVFTLRAAASTTDGLVGVTGTASTYEEPYEMYDAYGSYMEVVSRGAAKLTLAAEPLVQLVLNHGGVPLASTGSGTLRLSESDGGLEVDADMDARMPTVQDVHYAMQRGDLTEMSFKFHITRGVWSPDYTEYRIESFDLHRGDVSIVNMGANPYTTVAVRAPQTPVLITHGDVALRTI